MSEATSSTGRWLDRPSIAPATPSGEELSRLVRRGFALRRFIPPALPEVAAKLLELTQRTEDVELAEVARLIERDVLLSARLMQLMRSPLYNRGVEITSIEQAVARLGLGPLRDMVAEVAVHQAMYGGTAYSDVLEMLQRHSAVVAHLSRRVALAAGVTCEYAYLTGLLHDIGLPAAITAIRIAYAGKKGEAGPPPLEGVWDELVRIHEQLAWHLTRQWELPEALRLALRHHHTVPEDAPDPVTSSVVCVADRLASAVGAGVAPFPDRLEESAMTADEEMQRACLRLSLDQPKLQELVVAAAEVVAEVDATPR